MDQIFANENSNDDANGSRFTEFEQQCINYIESQFSINRTIDIEHNNNNDDIDDDEFDREIRNEKALHENKLWNYFQSSALAIVQLYSRDNVTPDVWNRFQQASTNVTHLYRESSEYNKKYNDVFQRIGYNKRTKEILNWIKKKKSMIRRDEILTFLASTGNGHQYIHTNNNNHYFHRNRTLLQRQNRLNSNNNRYTLISNESSSVNTKNDSIVEDHISNNELDSDNNDELETFKEALVSNIRNSAVLFNNNNNNNSNNKRNNQSIDEDLNQFIDRQYHRHVESRKRTSSMDICMDYLPNSNNQNNNKRAKYC